MWQAELAKELNSTAPEGRSRVIDGYAERTGKSAQHLYRIAKKHGFESGRKRRADFGELRCGLSDDQVEYAIALMYETGRELKGPIMPAECAIQIMEDNGLIDRGQVTPSTLNRILRERGISKRDIEAPDAHCTMRSLHPNHVHAFDVSVCVQYYLNKGQTAIMDSRVFYRNKPENAEKIKTRLLRYVLVDHFSGAFYVKYFDTTGETSNNLFDFLCSAWAPKESAKFPFRGVPLMLLMDAGSANKSRAIIAMLERLGVEIPKGMPHNPRRQGSVEVMHSVIEQWFESRLRIDPARSLEEINANAADFCAWFNGDKLHTRHGMTRTAAWLLIKNEQLRELPERSILNDLFAAPEKECTVDGNYVIRFRGNEYLLKHVPGLHARTKVTAILKPWLWPVIAVQFGGEVYEAKPLSRLAPEAGGFREDAAVFGEYAARPETEVQRTKKRMDNAAFGEERGKDDAPFAGLTVFGIHEDKLGENLTFMPRTGDVIQVDRSVVEKRLTILSFIQRVKDETGEMTAELNQAIRAEFGETISGSDADDVIRAIKAGEWPKRAEDRPRLRAVG